MSDPYAALMARRLANLFRRHRTVPAAPTGLDASTLAALEPGRDEFRSMHPRGPRVITVDRVPVEDDDRGPFDTITIDAARTTAGETSLGAVVTWAARHVRVGGTVEVEVPNALVAALIGIEVGVTPDELAAFITTAGLTTEAYGIGYVPQSVARGEPFAGELDRNPGVYATPADCVLLAYRCRKPIDASS